MYIITVSRTKPDNIEPAEVRPLLDGIIFCIITQKCQVDGMDFREYIQGLLKHKNTCKGYDDMIC